MEPVPHCPVPNVDFVTVGIGHSVGVQLHDMPCHAMPVCSLYTHTAVFYQLNLPFRTLFRDHHRPDII